jgi:hypothetical protein
MENFEYKIVDYPPYLINDAGFDFESRLDQSVSHLERFSKYEEWIMKGCPEGGIDLTDIPMEHQRMMEFGEEAFQIYRHALWIYLERVCQLNPWTALLRSMITKMRAIEGFSSFVAQTNEGFRNFSAQRMNAVQSHAEGEVSPSVRAAVRSHLKVYAEYYEIDYPFWFLSVVAHAVNSGRIRANLLGGSNSQSAQGSLIEVTRSKLTGTPMLSYFEGAYDSALRNCVLHNDYEIREQGDQVTVHSLSDGRYWEWSEIHRKLVNTQHFVEAVVAASAYINVVDKNSESLEFNDSGVVHTTLFLPGDGIPELWLFQMWCFYEMDPSGRWIDSKSVNVESLEEGLIRIRMSDRVVITDVEDNCRTFAEAVREHGWLRVKRVSVAPDLGLGFPSFESRGNYEVTGVMDEHFVRLVD